MSSKTPIDPTAIKLDDTSSQQFSPQFTQTQETNSEFDYMKYIKQISQSFENGKFTVLDPKTQQGPVANTRPSTF